MQTNNAHEYTDAQLQAAIDAAFPAGARPEGFNLDNRPSSVDWKLEAPNRLAIARAFLAALPERPQAAEIARLKEERDKAQAEISKWHAELSAVMPADFKDWHENAQAEWPFVAAQVIRNLRAREESALGMEKKAQAVATVVLTQAVRRMEAVPVGEIARPYETAAQFHASECGLEAVRARLIAAAKGEGQPGEKCPLCGAEEVESNTPNTTYACGSSDYDGRPETFHPGDKCGVQAVDVNEPPQDEEQQDLSGESEKQTEPAWILHDGGPCPLKNKEVDEWQVKWIYGAVDDYKELAPSHAAGWDGNIIAYRVLKWKPGHGPQAASKADEPAQAQPCVCGSPTTIGTVHRSDGPCYQAEDQPTTSPSWKPAVGDVVRLKSGGPAMTVLDPEEDGEFWCAWFDGIELRGSDFRAASLTPAKEVQP